MPLVVAEHHTYLCFLLLFMAILISFFLCVCLIGVCVFDGSACMRVVFLYRAAEGAEY
jgi:uncharacterized membrane protein